jgi:hypothetical protein
MAGDAADEITLHSKPLTRVPAGCAISLSPLAANGGQARAKLRQETKAFRASFQQAQILTRPARKLKRLATALRRTSGKLVASYLAT